MKFLQGDRVQKTKGYKFVGYVNGSFPYLTPTGEVDTTKPLFVNVQCDDGWIMHFRENELEKV